MVVWQSYRYNENNCLDDIVIPRRPTGILTAVSLVVLTQYIIIMSDKNPRFKAQWSWHGRWWWAVAFSSLDHQQPPHWPTSIGTRGCFNVKKPIYHEFPIKLKLGTFLTRVGPSNEIIMFPRGIPTAMSIHSQQCVLYVHVVHKYPCYLVYAMQTMCNMVTVHYPGI